MESFDEVKARVMDRFCAEIDNALEKKKWTRNKLKNSSGVSLEHYSKDEGGRIPNLVSAVRIADALGLSLDQMCGRSQYFKNADQFSAAECLSLLLRLMIQLAGDITASGGITLAPSNVSDTLAEAFEFRNYYTDARRFDSKYFSRSVEEAVIEWLNTRIEEMEMRAEQVTITLYGAERYASIDGTIYLGPDCFTEDPDELYSEHQEDCPPEYPEDCPPEYPEDCPPENPEDYPPENPEDYPPNDPEDWPPFDPGSIPV